MDHSIEFPLDSDGFPRRECPHCEVEFKMHHGKTDAAPADFVYPDVYWCPLCGSTAGHDSWWTQPQLEFQQQALSVYAQRELAKSLESLAKSRRDGLIQIKVTSGGQPEMPNPLVELDDMDAIAPPCHPWEPVKVPSDAVAPFYCLICGEAYAV